MTFWNIATVLIAVSVLGGMLAAFYKAAREAGKLESERDAANDKVSDVNERTRKEVETSKLSDSELDGRLDKWMRK